MGELFEQVQMQNIFPDGKTFPDCAPKVDPEKIIQAYQQEKDRPGFNLAEFVNNYFDAPASPASEYQTNPDKTDAQHINELWSVLTRKPDEQKGSLIPLPFPYIVPGGRFREIY